MLPSPRLLAAPALASLLAPRAAGAPPSPADPLAEARAAYESDGPGAALPLLGKALAGCRDAGDRRCEAIALGLVGNCHKRLGDLDTALVELRQALAALSPELRPLVRGTERADSVAFDMHKWMSLPYEIGVALVRDPQLHRGAFALTPAHLEHGTRGIAGGDIWFSDYGVELSRGFRALKEHGAARFGQIVLRNVDRARRSARASRRRRTPPCAGSTPSAPASRTTGRATRTSSSSAARWCGSGRSSRARGRNRSAPDGLRLGCYAPSRSSR